MLVMDEEEETRDGRGHFQTMMQLWRLSKKWRLSSLRAVLMKVWLDQWWVLKPKPPGRRNPYLAEIGLQEYALGAQSVADCSPGAARPQSLVDQEGQGLGRPFNYAPLNRRNGWWVFMATSRRQRPYHQRKHQSSCSATSYVYDFRQIGYEHSLLHYFQWNNNSENNNTCLACNKV